MRFLAICHYGHSRSVCCTRVLHERGHEAAAIGAGTCKSLIPLACGWSDFVILMQPEFVNSVPEGFRDKVVVFDVGPDIWSNPYDHCLHKIIQSMCDREGW